jgi:hypothetical protein
MIKLKFFILFIVLCFPVDAGAWGNGPSGNATTNKPSECNDVPYSTHDWIADHALALLPDEEKAWLLPYKTYYLLGTEAPDNDDIPDQCGAPNNGYDDRRKGHSVEWAADWSGFAVVNGKTKDRAASRAKEEYDKAVSAYRSGNLKHAAYYLGAMAHYIGDTSQYGHAVPFENHHGDYENWAKSRTDSFNDGHFETFITLDSLVRRTPYTAVKRISKITAGGKGKILWATRMDELYPQKNNNQEYKDSVGFSLNKGVNELADVLHTFYLNEVKP